ncbi:MAG: solute carrier family 26 protein [Saprospiraceae bacterium]
MNLFTLFSRFFPLASQLSGYNQSLFRSDFLAALTVWLLLIPQVMAYAMLAGMPPIYGLYGGLIPPLIYGLLGTSPQLSIGPVASTSLVILAGIRQLAEPESASYVELAILAGMLAGIAMFLMGLLRLGFLSVLLSQPVIVGFTAAAGTIIAVSQLKSWLGFDIPRFNQSYQTLWYAITHLHQTHWLTFAFCTGGILLMVATKRWLPKIPGTLIVGLISILATYLFRFDQAGLAIVADVPQGLPPFTIPDLSLSKVQLVMPTVLVALVTGVVENISIAKSLEMKNKTYKIQPNQELIAAGAARWMGALFQGMPISASFTRSAVNNEAGAKTGLSSVLLAIMTALTLLFLTPLVYYLPKAILAAIILMAVKSLIDVASMKRLWKLRKRDFLMMLATFMATLFISIEMGVVTGVVLSLILVLYKNSRPHIAVLGQLPESREFRNYERFPDAKRFDDIVIARFDAPLYFLNADYFMEFVNDAIQDGKGQCKLFILDASSITDIDYSGMRTLEELVADLRHQGVDLYLAGMIGPVRDMLNHAGICNQLGKDHHFLNVYDAVHYYQRLKKGLPPAEWSEAALQYNSTKKTTD